MSTTIIASFALFLPGIGVASMALAFVLTAFRRKDQALFVGTMGVVTLLGCMLASLPRLPLPLPGVAGAIWRWVMISLYVGVAGYLLVRSDVVLLWVREREIFGPFASSAPFGAGFRAGLVVTALWLLASAAVAAAMTVGLI